MTSDPISLSVGRRVNAERLVVLGWSRAILLQLAHPLIAAGVFDHSGFRASPMAALSRLHHTVGAMIDLTFGDETGRQRALDAIRTIHARVHGTLPQAVGPFPGGTRYSAEDPDLVLWVHVTLLDSVPLVYERLVAPLSPAERDAYCREAAPVAISLGARPPDVPQTWDAMRAYLEGMYGSGLLVVSPQARDLAGALVEPSFASWVRPLARLNQLVTFGLLPGEIRAQYGIPWSPADAAALDRWLERVRRLRRLAPRTAAWWADARRILPPTAR
ncbi:MAG TPA: oxygenase MpaB family protein [Vicinamibacterales bacterium]|nr:oxygenase MpaB family protein [Vicinamibacterales bacterium]